jgi:hypothetical protein
MARMLPDRIPKDVDDDPRRSAERRVYDRLAATLDDRCTVFGWVPWLREGERGGLTGGEADFLITHHRGQVSGSPAAPKHEGPALAGPSSVPMRTTSASRPGRRSRHPCRTGRPAR